MIDFNLNEGDPTISDDAACVIQQIDILFGSRPGDLFGDTNFGTQYDNYLYKLKLSPDQIKYRMEQDLNRIDLLGFTYGIEVYLMQGTERDIILIEVTLMKGTQAYTKSYKIT